MKVLWYILSLSAIICILVNNSKSKYSNIFNTNIYIFRDEDSALSILDILTWSTVSMFLFLTIIVSTYYFDKN